MARFSPGGSFAEEISKGRGNLAPRSVPRTATPSSGSSLQAKRAALESMLSGGVASGTPNPPSDFLRSGSRKNSPLEESGGQGVPKSRALASRFENAGPPASMQLPFRPKLLESPEGSRSSVPLKKLSAGHIPLDAKPLAPKPPPSFSKPPPITDSSRREEGECGNVPASTRTPPLLKQKSYPMMGQPKNPDFAKRPSLPASEKEENSDPDAPKKKPLPGKFVLGAAPPKPRRPPSVSLGKFQKGIGSDDDDVPRIKHVGPPPVPASPPGTLVPPSVPPCPLRPILPHQRSDGGMQPDESVDEDYDDVGALNQPPPLPGSHPAQKMEQESESDGEMYEDFEERWATAETTEKAKKPSLKEERKRQEQEKKEQKEREKKELEIRKRFKLSGPIQVIHRVKVRVDCKGGKNDLAVKRGELVDIVRVLDNPGGRWLGRAQDGSFGYVKTESVEVDQDHLKRTQLGGPHSGTGTESLEVYDDVGALDDFNGSSQAAISVMPEEDGDIYDDLDDSNQREQSSSPPLPPPPPPNLDMLPEDLADEIYDDVDAEGFPPPPIISKFPQIKPKLKTEERDPKKQKKFEKEEKEFRKKFKFDGEIQVLYQVTVASTLTTRKWGSKDLPLKPGEKIDVIAEPGNDKLIARSQEGKIGYVSMSNIIPENDDIYDDIGEDLQDCIYDND